MTQWPSFPRVKAPPTKWKRWFRGRECQNCNITLTKVTWSTRTCVELNLSSVTFRDKSVLSWHCAVYLTFGPKISKIAFIDKILDISRDKNERAVTHRATVQPEVCLLDNCSFLAKVLMPFYLRVKLGMTINLVNKLCMWLVDILW